MQADDDARIIVGFKEKSNASKIFSILDDIKVKSIQMISFRNRNRSRYWCWISGC
jgi:hypothetical protein